MLQSSRRHLSEIPLLFPAIGMALGIVVPVIAGGMPTWFWLTIIILAILAGMLLKCPRLVMSMLGSLVGLGAMSVATPGGLPIGKDCEMRGIVVENDEYGELQRLVVDVGGNCRVAVSVYDYNYQVEPGDSVGFSGLLLPAVRETSVADEMDGSQFSLTRYLSARMVAREFEITSSATGIRGWINGLRRGMLDILRYSRLSDTAANFLSAILLGDDSVDSEVRREFSQAGLSHVLALSGTHVSVIAMLIAFLFFPVEMAGSRRVRVLLTIFVLWGFALLTGMSPSVVRAVVMASFLLLGRALGRYSSSFNSLCCGAMGILLFDPVAVFMPGFQLSFSAVIGILLFMPMLQEWLLSFRFFHRRWAMVCAKAIALPVSVVVATAPLSALHFHSFPLWFLIANLPVAITLPFMLIGGIMLLVLGGCGIGCNWVADVLNSLYDGIVAIAHVASSLPGNNYGQGLYFSAWLLLPIYSGLFLLWLSWNCRSRVYLINGAAMLVCALMLLPIAVPTYPRREAYAWHDGRSLNILYRDSADLYIITDALPKYYPELRERCEALLVDYLGKRNASVKRIVADSLTLPGVNITKSCWQIDNHRYFIVRDSIPSELATAFPFKSDVATATITATTPLNATIPNTAATTPNSDFATQDYLVITWGFRGDILEFAACYPDVTIILSPSLPVQRRSRYVHSLTEASYPFLLNLPQL